LEIEKIKNDDLMKEIEDMKKRKRDLEMHLENLL